MDLTAYAQSTVPDYITPDTYKGRWQVTHRTDAHLGRRSARWIAEHIGEGNTAVVWEFSGHTRSNRLLFTRTRFISANGELHGYDSDGAKKIVHPADRVIGFISA